MDTQKTNVTQSTDRKQRPDDDVHDDLLERLGDDRDVDISNIDVIVASGHVVLNGTIPEEHGKERAGEIAAGTPGVSAVENRLRVEPLDNGIPMSDTFV